MLTIAKKQQSQFRNGLHVRKSARHALPKINLGHDLSNEVYTYRREIGQQGIARLEKENDYRCCFRKRKEDDATKILEEKHKIH